MTATVESNKQFLTDLFAGPFRGHAIAMKAQEVQERYVREKYTVGDFICSDKPVANFAPMYEARYEGLVEGQAAIGDDSVPYAGLNTNTGLFATAFGCELHEFDEMQTPACALPFIKEAAEADALPEPGPHAPPLDRVFELAALLRKRLGPDAIIGVPDIQSPFDIAALIWNKEDLFVAMVEEPDAVTRLVEKVYRLLTAFLAEFKREFAPANLCHCPYAWAPPELGAWLSEDEAGSLSPTMFEDFCLPTLARLSEDFGGLFMHCCATADHQYPSFRKIPNLRGLNRVFQAPGPGPAIEAFSGETVLIQAWLSPDNAADFIAMATPETRYYFDINPMSTVDDARRALDRLRELAPRTE